MSENLFSGYFGVLPENMVVPVALFLNESGAQNYAQEQYRDRAIIKKFPTSSLSVEVRPLCCKSL